MYHHEYEWDDSLDDDSDNFDWYEEYHVMTRCELIINWFRRLPWRLKRLYWRVKWHNRCMECGIAIHNGYCLCDKHEIPF